MLYRPISYKDDAQMDGPVMGVYEQPTQNTQ